MYDAVRVIGFTPLDDGRVQLNVEYTGNAGEPSISDSIMVAAEVDTEADLVAIIRRDAIRKNKILNNRTSLVNLIRNNIPYTIDVSPIVAPASTAGQYMAASAPFTPAATPQDVFTISNPGNKRIVLTGAGISTTQSTAGRNAWSLFARSTLNSGGAPTPVAAIPTGPGFPAATAEVRVYTGNPTAGTPLGRLWTGRVSSPASATAAEGNANLDLTQTLQRIPIVIPQNVVVAFNFGGAALPTGLSVVAWFAWTES